MRMIIRTGLVLAGLLVGLQPTATWTAAAQEGRFEIRPEVGSVAGLATYLLAVDLPLGRLLAGELPRPAFPPRLREPAPAAWPAPFASKRFSPATAWAC